MTFEAITNDITRFQTQLKVVVSDLRTAPLRSKNLRILRGFIFLRFRTRRGSIFLRSLGFGRGFYFLVKKQF